MESVKETTIDDQAVLMGNWALLFVGTPCAAFILDVVSWPDSIVMLYWILPFAALVRAHLCPRQLTLKGLESLLLSIWLLLISTTIGCSRAYLSGQPLGVLADPLLDRLLVLSVLLLSRQFLGRLVH